MLVKVLDENRVKILMEDQDIAYYDLPFEKLNYDDPISRAFIYDLIQKTYEHTGVDFKNSRVMIEVIPGVSGSYYVLLTRMEQTGKEKIEFDKTECCDREMYIFKLERAYQLSPFFKRFTCQPPEQSRLYFYGNAYYAVVTFSPTVVNGENFRLILLSLEEFGSRCRYHFANEGLLKEWGECILEKNAYDYFLSS